MTTAAFFNEARLIASRNRTENVRAISASLKDSHLSVTYYTATEPTSDDDEERELTVGELIAAFPSIRSADSHSVVANELADATRSEQLIFEAEAK